MTLTYNSDNQRIEKQSNSGTTKFIWDGETYLAETDGADSTTAVYSNMPSNYGDLISQRRGANTNFYHSDSLGTTREITSSAESITDTFLSDAWGNEISHIGASVVPFRYVGSQGYYYDSEMTNFYVRSRVYDQAIGRWTSRDPLDILGIQISPFQKSSYFAANNNPINYHDPTGLVAQKPGGGGTAPVGPVDINFGPGCINKLNDFLRKRGGCGGWCGGPITVDPIKITVTYYFLGQQDYCKLSNAIAEWILRKLRVLLSKIIRALQLEKPYTIPPKGKQGCPRNCLKCAELANLNYNYDCTITISTSLDKIASWLLVSHRPVILRWIEILRRLLRLGRLCEVQLKVRKTATIKGKKIGICVPDSCP